MRRLQDFEQRLVRLMVDTDGREGCPVRREVERLIEARRWSITKVLEHNPARMMRIALEVRSRKFCHGQAGNDPDLQRRVLVSSPPNHFPVPLSCCLLRPVYLQHC